jgi:hypothetical protein
VTDTGRKSECPAPIVALLFIHFLCSVCPYLDSQRIPNFTLHETRKPTAKPRTMSSLLGPLKWFYHEFGVASIHETGSNAWLIIFARSCRMFAYGTNVFFGTLDTV